MVHKKVVGFGLAAAGFFIAALLVAGAAIGGDGGMADDRIVDLSVSEGGSGGALAASSVTSGFNYQGRLTDSGGNPLSGTYDITFRLYDAASGGTALAEVLHSIMVNNGLFATTITFDPTYFDGRALWLGIQVGYDPEMTPRQALRAVPYAISLRPGAVIEGSLVDEPILWARNSAENGNALNACVAGNGGTGVRVVALGEESQGVRTWSNGTDSVGVHAITTGDNSEGVVAETHGADCVGVGIFTSGDGSEGVYAYTTGNDSDGVYAWTTGDNSPAVYGWSEKDVGVYGKGNEAGGYFTTTAAGTLGHAKLGVNVSTQYNFNPGVLIDTLGDDSDGVFVYTSGNASEGVSAYTSGDGSYGVSVSTSGITSRGVFISTGGVTSQGVLAYTAGNYSEGVYVKTSGYSSEGVSAYTSGDDSEGVSAHTSGNYSGGFSAYTSGNVSDGVWAVTIGNWSDGFYAHTSGNYSYGVRIYTDGIGSRGVYAETSGNYSPAVCGLSEKDVGVYGKGNEAGGYFTTTAAGARGQLKPGVDIWTSHNYNPGVLINTAGDYSTGVIAETHGIDSIGVYGYSEKSYAGFFEGPAGMGIYVDGNISKTGSVSFVEDHPTDPTKEIVYVCLEGGETGTYTRGSAQLIDGEAVVQLPEHFSVVTSSGGLTVQVTPTSDCKGLYVISKSPTEFVVKELNGGTSDATFDYFVNGIRKGYEEFQPIRDKQEMPERGDLARAPEHLEAEEHSFPPEPPTAAAVLAENR
jgi:hypothetical protein